MFAIMFVLVSTLSWYPCLDNNNFDIFELNSPFKLLFASVFA